MNIEEKPICLLCLEDKLMKEDFHSLSCTHSIHIPCAKKLISNSCPFCRKEMDTLPKDIQNQIQENKRKHADEQKEDELEELREDIRQEIRGAVQRAIADSRGIGIPIRFLPEQILNISVSSEFSDTDILQNIYRVLLQSNIYSFLEHLGSLEDENLDENFENEYLDDVFSEENIRLLESMDLDGFNIDFL